MIHNLIKRKLNSYKKKRLVIFNKPFTYLYLAQYQHAKYFLYNRLVLSSKIIPTPLFKNLFIIFELKNMTKLF